MGSFLMVNSFRYVIPQLLYEIFYFVTAKHLYSYTFNYLCQVLKMMVGNNLKDTQLQQIVDKTILFADKDEDGKISFDEFCAVSVLPGVIMKDSLRK